MLTVYQWAVLPRFLNLLNILKVWYWDPSLLLSTYKLSKFQNLFRYLGHGHLNIKLSFNYLVAIQIAPL